MTEEQCYFWLSIEYAVAVEEFDRTLPGGWSEYDRDVWQVASSHVWESNRNARVARDMILGGRAPDRQVCEMPMSRIYALSEQRAIALVNGDDPAGLLRFEDIDWQGDERLPWERSPLEFPESRWL